MSATSPMILGYGIIDLSCDGWGFRLFLHGKEVTLTAFAAVINNWLSKGEPATRDKLTRNRQQVRGVGCTARHTVCSSGLALQKANGPAYIES
uniref:Uncharacterized protein n=1 Tax=Oryza barthii TaxID=65489 RepID=A0A0D3GDF5_9ORYZ